MVARTRSSGKISAVSFVMSVRLTVLPHLSLISVENFDIAQFCEKNFDSAHFCEKILILRTFAKNFDIAHFCGKILILRTFAKSLPRHSEFG